VTRSGALRFVELAPEACGVVYAEHGRVAWSARNDALWHA
jgi:hypothetical protein